MERELAGKQTQIANNQTVGQSGRQTSKQVFYLPKKIEAPKVYP